MYYLQQCTRSIVALLFWEDYQTGWSFFVSSFDKGLGIWLNAMKIYVSIKSHYRTVTSRLSRQEIKFLICRLSNLAIFRASSRHLLCAVSARNAHFEFFWTFSHTKNFKFTCCLGGFHVHIAINLLKSALFYLYRTHALLPF